MFLKSRLGTISHFAVLALLSPVALIAQSALVAVPGTALGAVYAPGEQSRGSVQEFSLAGIVASDRDGTAIYDNLETDER
ncbi:MAG: hypothetical protein ACLQVL_31290 [Terriglobia bacterium]